MQLCAEASELYLLSLDFNHVTRTMLLPTSCLLPCKRASGGCDNIQLRPCVAKILVAVAAPTIPLHAG
jgi:hypothetical protein